MSSMPRCHLEKEGVVTTPGQPGCLIMAVTHSLSCFPLARWLQSKPGHSKGSLRARHCANCFKPAQPHTSEYLRQRGEGSRRPPRPSHAQGRKPGAVSQLCQPPALKLPEARLPATPPAPRSYAAGTKRPPSLGPGVQASPRRAPPRSSRARSGKGGSLPARPSRWGRPAGRGGAGRAGLPAVDAWNRRAPRTTWPPAPPRPRPPLLPSACTCTACYRSTRGRSYPLSSHYAD